MYEEGVGQQILRNKIILQRIKPDFYIFLASVPFMMDKIDRVRLRLDGRPVKGILEDKEAEVRWVDSHLEDN